LVIRILLVVGLALTAWQGWSHFTAAPPEPIRAPVSADAIAGVQITLGQAALALRDFGTGGLLSDRFDFESNMARVRRSLDVFERSASEADARHALGRAKSLLERLIQIEKAHIARVNTGGGAMGSQTLAEIPSLRDETAGALADFREAGIRRVTVAEPDSLARLLQGSATAAIGLLSLCIGAISLWSRLFST
jgi:hypothetical protein